jgi:hypothetical protein
MNAGPDDVIGFGKHKGQCYPHYPEVIATDYPRTFRRTRTQNCMTPWPEYSFHFSIIQIIPAGSVDLVCSSQHGTSQSL